MEISKRRLEIVNYVVATKQSTISYPLKAKHFLNVLYFLKMENNLMNCIILQRVKSLAKKNKVVFHFFTNLLTFPRNRKYFSKICCFYKLEKTNDLC